MGMIMDSITEWLKEILVSGIISNLSGMFDSVNQRSVILQGKWEQLPSVERRNLQHDTKFVG